MIDERLARFPPRKSKDVSYREAGAGRPVLLLHGIGSSSAGWLNQLEGLSGLRLVAWDAPGYGDSAFLPSEKPNPAEYANALGAFVDRLLLKDVYVVGNSLGCLMAGAFAKAFPEKVRGMLLISPAGGYAGDLSVVEPRLKALEELGPEGMAEKRSPSLLGGKHAPEALELARWSQRRIRPQGYKQACYCLANGRLEEDARGFRKKVVVICGTEDKVTPEEKCKRIAQAYQAEYRSLPGIGHLAHLEDPPLVNKLVLELAK